MAVSEVSICNAAIIRLSRSKIISLDDPSDLAAMCKILYADRRRFLLASHPWNFAVTRQALVALTLAADLPIFGFSTAFNLPTDPECLRVLDTSLDDTWGMPWGGSVWSESVPELWQTEVVNTKTVLVANTNTIAVRYIFDQVDPAKFRPYFVEAFSVDLAAELAYPVTQNQGVAEYWRKLADRELSKAKAKDGQEGRHGQYQSSGLIQVRF